ncbi:MAG: hypothetical protein ACP5OA_06960 [Candidatus Woesearchaeota archaeon]
MLDLTKSDNELTDKLISGDFEGFELLGRLSYNGGLHITYPTKLFPIEKNEIITAKHHYTRYLDPDDPCKHIALQLEKIVKDNNISLPIQLSAKSSIYDSYAQAAGKILDATSIALNSGGEYDFQHDDCTDVYFLITRPNTSSELLDACLTCSHFESTTFVMYLLKHNSDVQQRVFTLK